MKIKFFSSRQYEIENLKNANRSHRHELSFEPSLLSIENVALAKGMDMVSIFTNDDLNAATLDKLYEYNIKYIAIRAAGYNNVDLKRARELGIAVANVPEYSPYSVAEHTVGIILALNRKYQQMRKRILQNDFSLDGLEGFDLHGKTIGVVGFGKIGKIVAKIMNGFGCSILAYDIKESSIDFPVRYTSLDELLRKSDVITLHAPLNDATQYLINKETLQKMKKGTMLVNSGRGALVDTNAVIESMKAGHLGYFGLDVYEREKGVFFFDHSSSPPNDGILIELLKLDNVFVAPHMGFLTSTALTNIADTTFENISAWSAGQKSPNEVA